jgi:predicted metal-dependent phosphoesterase TrpH
MDELTVNLHMHTTYSDGSGSHADLGRIALDTGVDVLLVTDHNIWVQGVDAYYRRGKQRTLLLAGEEIHDQDRVPQKNHLLVFGAQRELAPLADDPQSLIDAVREAGGICFIAHPVDPALPAFSRLS